MAFQDGRDKYVGIIGFLNQNGIRWNIHLDRMSKSVDNLGTYKLSEFDGVIADDPPSQLMAQSLARLRIPLVAIDWRDYNPLRNRHQCVRVESDPSIIGKTAAKEMLATDKYASYAYLPTSQATAWSSRRGAAFEAALASRRIPVTFLDPRRPIVPQLRKLPKPSAIFAANDVTAAKLLVQMKAAEIAVPEDVSILGVDNETLTCLHSNPPLASIQLNFEEAGQLAARSLHAMMSGKCIFKRRTYRIKSVVHRKSMGISSPSGRLVQRAIELIRNTPVADFRGISAIAKQLGISRRLLDRRFRQIDGRSVLEAVQERRLEEVCNLLINSNLSILDICEACFPKSGSYPMRLFKRKFGMTMRAYRVNAKKAHASFPFASQPNL